MYFIRMVKKRVTCNQVMMVFEAKFDIRRKIKKSVKVQFEKDVNFLISNCSLKLHENC